MPVLEKLGNNSLVVLKEDKEVFSSEKEGLRPIVMCLNKIKTMKGCTVIDKVVGLAAAKLFLFAGADKIHAKIASSPASSILGSKISAETIVSMIMNKDKTEQCPMEILAKKLSGRELFEKLNKSYSSSF